MVRKIALAVTLLAFGACSSSSNAGDDDSTGNGNDAGSDSSTSPTDASPDGNAIARDSGADGSSSSLVPSTLGGAAVVGSVGCGKTGATGVQNISLTVGSTTRTGIYFVPADYDSSKAYPIVFVFHGDGGTGTDIRSQLDLETAAGNKAIFAYPDGASQTWDATLASTNQDMAFVMAVRASLRSQYCADTTRTFVTGMSRGAYFVNQLACMYGVAELTAIAPHSGTISAASNDDYIYGPPNANGGPYTENGNYDFRCPVDPTDGGVPILPPPAFVIHGECDQEEGVTYAEGRTSVEHWGFAARCTTTPAVAVTTSPNPTCTPPLVSNPTLAVDPCYVAPGCASGHDVTFCAIPGMGHQVWNDAPTRIWNFFAAH
jgi:polyhydroxybutyrate depolymerase